MAFFLGIDLGTSGVRCAVIDAKGQEQCFARANYPVEQTAMVDSKSWLTAVDTALTALSEQAPKNILQAICAASIAGTSGTMVLVDTDLQPVTQGLMYYSSGFDVEAVKIETVAPQQSISKGSNGALARFLRLQSQDNQQCASYLCHQSDFILAHLIGQAGVSDDNNTLKLGYDPLTQQWPDWFEAAGVRLDLLPKVFRVGDYVGTITKVAAQKYGLSENLKFFAGTTDSTAAFFATDCCNIGDAVTSLGTTLAIKLLSDQRIAAPEFGVYSHFVEGKWLVGGASNTGGGVLLAHFSKEDLMRLSAQIDPETRSDLAYYPLIKAGERFPVNDPNKLPILTPRPDSDVAFLKGMLEGIAQIEADCYARLFALKAPDLIQIQTAGGGAKNVVWNKMRRKIVHPNIVVAVQNEASIGVAKLARNGFWRCKNNKQH